MLRNESLCTDFHINVKYSERSFIFEQYQRHVTLSMDLYSSIIMMQRKQEYDEFVWFKMHDSL